MGKLYNNYKRNLNSTIASLIFRFTILILLSSKISAQVENPRFRYLTLEDGLFNSQITCIYQDSLGFMWIGTENGLHKYDGYDFKVFRHIPGDSTSLTNHTVQTIVEDHQKNLWVGTKYGLNKLDLRTEKITQIIQDNEPPAFSEKNQIEQLVFDADNKKIWIISDQGLVKKDIFNKSRDTIIKINREPTCALMDSSGELWIGTNNGLCKIDRHTCDTIPAFPNFQLLVYDIEEDGKGSLWLSVSNNIKKDSVKTEIYVVHKENTWATPQKISFSNDYNFLNHGPIKIYKDKSNKIWASTNYGFFEFLKDQAVLRYTKNKDNPNSLLSNQVNGFCQDSDSIYWIGTHGGINLLNSKEQRFIHHKLPFTQDMGDESYFIRSILEDSEGIVWIGTENAGLFKLDAEETYPIKQKNNDENEIKRIDGVVEDQNGNIWLGTWHNGLIKIDKKENELIRIEKVKSNRITALFVDKEGYIWIGTPSLLIQFNPEQSDVYIHKENIKVRTINQDAAGIIWIGTNGEGLFKFQPRPPELGKNELISVPIQGADTRYNGYNVINKIMPERDSLLWIATYGGGLVKMNTKKDTCFFYNSNNTGLPDDIIYGILREDNGSIWTSTNKGISVFDPKKKYGEVWTLDYRDGLQSNEFNSGVCYQTKDGKMYFGGINGFNSFYPNSIRKSKFQPPVVFTAFFINNRPVSTNINYSKTISLKHTQSNVRIEVAALDFYIPEKIQYQYWLIKENKDTTSSGAGKNRSFNFMNLSPGNYELKVNGTNHDGVWSDKIASLKIRIYPPWHWNLYAWGIYAILIFGGIIELYRFQLKQKLDHAENIQLKKNDEDKRRFFANITHELRTPLQIIIGEIDHIKENEEHKKLILFYARALANRINKILDLSKLESKKMELYLVQDEVISFVKMVTDSFQTRAKNKNIYLQFQSDETELFMDFDPERLQQILTNLLDNAFKFTPENGKVKVKIIKVISRNNLFLKIEASDTGIGIEKENQEKIFERYFQEDNSKISIYRGTGIGLALIKELIHLMGGSIQVESEKGKGSTFIILLPITQTAEKKAAKLSDIELEDSLIVSIPADDRLTSNDKKPTVLLIEDNHHLLENYKSLLQNDYTLLFASDGQMGIDKAIREVPDIIISDVMMPKKNGNEVCEILKEHELTCHIPIILLTAKGGEAYEMEGREKGADDYLTKPFNKKTLFIRLRNLLSQQKKLREKYASEIIIRFTNKDVPPIEDSFLRKLVKSIENNYSDPDFGIEQLCKEVAYGRSQLQNKVKGSTGKSVNRFILLYRLKKAKMILMNPDYNEMTIKEIAYSVGMTHNYFSRSYKKGFGERPSETRNRNKL